MRELKKIHTVPFSPYEQAEKVTTVNCAIIMSMPFRVAALESVNQMNAKNLALVFGPNMMWRDSPTDDYARFSVVGCACTEFLIANNAAVFDSSTN